MIEVELDLSELNRFLDSGKRAVDRTTDLVARSLRDNISTESSPVSSRISRSWRVRPGRGTERRVVAGEDAWFAHFLAGGTRPHGPRSANRLVFEIGNKTIWAKRVRGIPATHFDERAIDMTETRVDQIMSRAIREAV